MLSYITINDETGDFVDCRQINAVMSTETVAGQATAPGSLIYLSGQEDVFVSPLTPKEVLQRMQDCLEPKVPQKEAA